MIKIHHARGTRGYRAIWACEELGIPYELEPTNMSPDYRASPEWRRMNPVGKVPVMTDGDLTMFESGAMVQHILDKYGDGRLQPTRGTNEYALYLQWGWFAESTFSRPLGEIVNHRRVFPNNPITAVTDEMKARARLCAHAVAAAVDGKQYLLGSAFSGADIMMIYPLKFYRRAGYGRIAGRTRHLLGLANEARRVSGDRIRR